MVSFLFVEYTGCPICTLNKVRDDVLVIDVYPYLPWLLSRMGHHDLMVVMTPYPYISANNVQSFLFLFDINLRLLFNYGPIYQFIHEATNNKNIFIKIKKKIKEKFKKNKKLVVSILWTCVNFGTSTLVVVKQFDIIQNSTIWIACTSSTELNVRVSIGWIKSELNTFCVNVIITWSNSFDNLTINACLKSVCSKTGVLSCCPIEVKIVNSCF